ncbi:hypothetical protein EGU77_22230 [Pseudomonas syringae pv. theae]|nr:hypothetical protein [Pseudomonas syringae pv. theae]MBL3838264.1 hypothetical protein [Pseudomonas syringae pv. theae]MBL3869229.1 hypothetical protein [Pseudomonas syringae pv. theae]MBL3872480.1 hypothetical protein [Pseudomonas syringae pv. theae]
MNHTYLDDHTCQCFRLANPTNEEFIFTRNQA